jgi:hypothetical protein
MDHEEFERRYEVYATYPQEAYQALSPAFLDAMVSIADDYAQQAIRAGFEGDRFLLSLPLNGEMFEPGSVFKSVYGCEENVRKLLKQVATANQLIDRLVAPTEQG